MSGVGRLAELGRDAEAGVSKAGDSWTILRMILWSAEYLSDKGVETGRLDAEWLLSSALGVNRLQLYLEYDRPLSSEEREAFKPLLRRRANREPATVHHRPDRVSATRVEDGFPGPDSPSRDRGSRPGGVGLGGGWRGKHGTRVGCWHRYRRRGAFARRGGNMQPGRRFRRLARGPFRGGRGMRNAMTRADSSSSGRARCSSRLEEGERFDIIVSNPPYIADGERGELQPEVRDWEPPEALFAGEDGLGVIRQLVAGAPEHLRAGGLLALECGLGQAKGIATDLGATGAFAAVRVLPDLTGRPRFVLAERAA